MTKHQAYELIASLAANFRGTLAEHEQIQEALKLLKPEEK